MNEFTSSARVDGDWWLVQCDQVPQAVSQVESLEEAEPVQRDAIAFVTGLNVREIEVLVRPVELPGG
jgi:hypothetical protein